MLVPPQHGRQTYPETCREDARAPRLHPPGECWRSTVRARAPGSTGEASGCPEAWMSEQRSGLLGV